MFDELKTLLEVSLFKKEVLVFFLAVIPIMLVYLGVSLYLLYVVCCSLQKKRKIKSKEVQTDDNIAFVMNINGRFLGQRDTADITAEFKPQTSPLTSPLRSPAQSALCEVIKRENLNALKSSLRKTQSNPVSQVEAVDKMNGLKVELEEKVVISATKGISDSDLLVSDVHNSSVTETSTIVSSIQTAICSVAVALPINSHSDLDLSKTKMSEVKGSPSSGYQPLEDNTRNETSPSSPPFVEIDLGNA